MSNQQIIDIVEDALPSGIGIDVREKILDAVWNVINDEFGMDLEVGGQA